jgi:HNH endonuclease
MSIEDYKEILSLKFLGFPLHRISDTGIVWGRSKRECRNSDVLKMKRLRQSGFTQAEVARMFGYASGACVYRLIKKGKRPRWKRLSPKKHKNGGHLAVTLGYKRRTKIYFVHRLVLLAFVGPCPQGMQCRHLNGDPTDNRVENLKWGTAYENAADAIRHGRSGKGVQNPKAKLTDDLVRWIRKVYVKGNSKNIARKLGVSPLTVWEAATYRKWKHVQ